MPEAEVADESGYDRCFGLVGVAARVFGGDTVVSGEVLR
jgi:hypothetical protein